MRILRDSTRKCVAVLTVAALLAIFGLNAQAGIILPGGLVGNDLTDPEDDGSLAGTVTYSAQKNDTEGALKAFDNSASTKWYTTSSTPMPHFITFQFDNPVPAEPNQKYAVNRYTISSANDSAQRDPDDWRFQGSPNGSVWIDVDVQADQAKNWTARHQTQDFQFTNTTGYEHYRFLFTKLRSATSNDLQLSEIEMFGTVVPEPATVTLLALGGIALIRRRRRA